MASLWPSLCILRRLANDEHLHKAFSFFDKNHSDYIEIEELQEALNDTSSEEVVAAIMQDVDTDKDGIISYEEFAAMMKAGMDWRKASRQYSRERFNSLSLKLMRDCTFFVFFAGEDEGGRFAGICREKKRRVVQSQEISSVLVLSS
ncbi:unnamed protein product [Eruca vesicaria subsp. sativa]|uniref:EF-hand domain-containing protein n=1 Tax=Eruca vesicaria subsp. sativa TaxID=29727 RepID=A0ABC8KHV4_ERUVS|nr:unnamed protein product [Eruca vesicaria subsp. sativa]